MKDCPPEHGLQQGKDYRVGELNNVPFVFSSNGHQFVEYDEATGQTSEPKPMTDFPRPHELIARYLTSRHLPAKSVDLKLLETGYAQGRDYLRYYQDAAIRATVEKIIRDRAGKRRVRALLSLATGSGKTRIGSTVFQSGTSTSGTRNSSPCAMLAQSESRNNWWRINHAPSSSDILICAASLL